MGKHTKYSIGRDSVTEVTYERDPSLSMGGYRGGRSIDGKGSSQFYSQNVEQTLHRRNRTVRELVTNNFRNDLCSFVTLTIDPIKFPFSLRLTDEEDVGIQLDKILETAVDLFRKFIRKLQARYTNLRYIAVPELYVKQGIRVSLHFHVLFELVCIRGAGFESLWGWGHVHTEGAYDVQGVAYYMTKGSDLTKYELQFGKKGYFASTGLRRNRVLTSWDIDNQKKVEMMTMLLAAMKPTSTFHTNNDFVGKVDYQRFTGIDLFDSKLDDSEDKKED